MQELWSSCIDNQKQSNLGYCWRYSWKYGIAELKHCYWLWGKNNQYTRDGKCHNACINQDNDWYCRPGSMKTRMPIIWTTVLDYVGVVFRSLLRLEGFSPGIPVFLPKYTTILSNCDFQFGAAFCHVKLQKQCIKFRAHPM